MRLKELRIAAGFSQKELAEKINLTAHNIGDWERGKAEPSIFWLEKLADVFNCTIDYLVGREDDFGIVQSSATVPTLTTNESELLSYFRTLSKEGRSSALEIISVLANYDKRH